LLLVGCAAPGPGGVAPGLGVLRVRIALTDRVPTNTIASLAGTAAHYGFVAGIGAGAATGGSDEDGPAWSGLHRGSAGSGRGRGWGTGDHRRARSRDRVRLYGALGLMRAGHPRRAGAAPPRDRR
jgi:hypothetical protein